MKAVVAVAGCLMGMAVPILAFGYWVLGSSLIEMFTRRF